MKPKPKESKVGLLEEASQQSFPLDEERLPNSANAGFEVVSIAVLEPYKHSPLSSLLLLC